MKGKKIKGAVCLLICVSILSINIYEAKASSLGGVVALGDALATAGAGGTVGCLLAPEVIIPMVLVALGVAGVGYVANSSVVQDIAEDLSELPEGWTVLQGGGSDPNNRRPFLKGFYRAGKVFLSAALLKKIAEIAEGYGLFDGVQLNSFTNQDNLSYGDKLSSVPIASMRNYVIKTLQDLGEVSMADRAATVFLAIERDIGTEKAGFFELRRNANYVYTVSMFINEDTENIIFNRYNGSVKAYLVNNVEHENYGSKYISPDLNFTLQSIESGNDIIIGVHVVENSNNATAYISSIGVNATEPTGIPVTNNLPSYDVEDGWRLPNWKYNGINIDPAADPEGASEAYPVTMPDGAEVPLIYPIGDEPTEWPEIEPEPYRWPNNLPSDPSDPDPGAQDEAQRGTVDVIPGIDEDPTISNETIFNSLTVPKSIREKFPFCLIYDVYDIYNITFYGVNPDSAKMGFKSDNAEFAVISSGSTSENIINVGAGRSIERKAPRFEWIPPNIPGFQNTEPIIIDLSMFDEYALKFRFCIYIIYSISIAMGLVNAYKGTFGSTSEDHGPAV